MMIFGYLANFIYGFGLLTGAFPSHFGSGFNYKCQRILSTGEVVQYCCDNHEEKNGRCIECQPGFMAVFGKPCQPCPTGWFGYKCQFKCVCNANQRCNNVAGCVDVANTTYLVSTLSFSEEIGNLSSTESVNLFSDVKCNNGFMKRELVLYSVFVIVIFLLVIVCLRYKSKARETNAYPLP